MTTENKPAPSPFTLEDAFRVLLRRHWLIIIPFCIAVIAGIVLAVKLPRIYRATTLILVEPQRVPKEYIQPVVDFDIGARINIISQQIKSRTNLEKVLEEFNLYTGPKYDRWFMEDKILKLRESILVDVPKRRRNESLNAFTIEFEGEDPLKIMRVTNALASYFIDENLKTREAHAVGTSDFLSEELETMKNNLIQLEEKLKNYRIRYMGSLPEQLETNLRILDRFQQQRMEKEQSLREARNTLIILDKQIAEAAAAQDAEPVYVVDASMTPDGGPVSLERGNKPAHLDQLKNDLKILETKYTDAHPDIKRLRRLIADLEKQKEAEAAAAGPQTEGVYAEPPAHLTPQSKYQMLLANRRMEIEKEIQTLEEDIRRINKATRVYEKGVEETPKREQELLTIKRDYENVKATYNSLLNRKLEAAIAVNMEKKQKGEQFRIIDPAKIPQNPIKPDMRKLFLLVVAAGLGAGIGLVLLAETQDKSFRRKKEIETLLEIPVMAVVPVLRRPGEVFLRRLKWVLGVCGAGACVVLVLLFFAITQLGLETTLFYVRQYV